MVNTDIPNMALADVIANSFARIPFMLMIISSLVAESEKPGSVQNVVKGLNQAEQVAGLLVTIMAGAQMICFLTLYSLSLVPMLIANGVVVSMQDATVYSVGSNCLYLYRYVQLEAVYPIVGLGFVIFYFSCRKCNQGHTSDCLSKFAMVVGLIYLLSGTVVLLYAISLVSSNGKDCRMMSDSVVNMATIDIVVNGIFRIPCAILAVWALTVFGSNNPDGQAKGSVPL